jgi:ssDNA-binding Zn-finger/Zn-ribbon topoisomerase 1
MSLVFSDQGAQSLICDACKETFLLEPKFDCVVTPLDKICPNCNFQAVEIKGLYTNIACPSCKNRPPPQFFKPDGVTTCRGCTNSACSLSKGTMPVRLCPVCRSHSMVLRSSKSGGSPFLSCSNYPQCNSIINLPPSQAVSVSSDNCEACSAKFAVSIRKLHFSFVGSGQSQGGPLQADHCVAGCSSDYMNPMLKMVNPKVENLFVAPMAPPPPRGAPPPPPGAPAAGRAAGQMSNEGLAGSYQNLKRSIGPKKNCGCGVEAPIRKVTKEGPNIGREFYGCGNNRSCNFFEWVDGEGNGGGNGGGTGGRITCYHCNQEGHFANACPRKAAAGGGGGSFGGGFAPAPQAAGRGSCFLCKQEGHYANNCPNKNQPQQQQQRFAPAQVNCFHCNQPGHFANACPSRGGSAPAPAAAAARKRTSTVKMEDEPKKKRGRPKKKD